MQVQYRLAVIEFMNDTYAYVEAPQPKSRSLKK
jgi:hypothetical protein